MDNAVEGEKILTLTEKVESLEDFVKKVLWTAIFLAFGFGGTSAVLQWRVSQNAENIAALSSKLDDQSSIMISRGQLEDILGVSDEKITNLEKNTDLINRKLDKILLGIE